MLTNLLISLQHNMKAALPRTASLKTQLSRFDTGCTVRFFLPATYISHSRLIDNISIYSIEMIKTFNCRDTEKLANRLRVRKFIAIERVAQRKLALISAATTLDMLRVPTGNRLEALKGNRKGQYSIRVNDQWRIRFKFEQGNA